MTLTEQQIHFWNENGYLVFENIFTPAEVERMRRGVEALIAQAEGLTESTDRFKLKAFETGGTMVQQIAEPHEMSGEWLDLAKDPRILDIVEGLLGPNIQLYYSMLMMKPPLGIKTSLSSSTIELIYWHVRSTLMTRP